MSNVICVILAGGKSRRMGQDKAVLTIDNDTFLTHLINTFKSSYSVFVSLAESNKFPHPGAGEIIDLRPGKGPLAGLEAAFKQTDADLVFLTATDLPLGTLDLAKILIELIENYDACVIRRSDGLVEPLFAVYSSSCLPHVQRLLDEGHYSFRELLETIRVRWVPESQIMEHDLSKVLYNVNSPDDYQKVLHMLV